MKSRIHPLYLFIFLTIPFVAWGKLQIWPTFDDWTTLSAPNFDTDWGRYIFSNGSFWRPFDALFGFFYAHQNPQLFPTVNHICILFGHLVNTYLVYQLCRELAFNRQSRAIATTFFYLSPCVWATVWACDSLNQTYSQLWGLWAVLVYLKMKSPLKYFLWFIFVFTAALAKENGLAWAIVPPILAFGFRRISRRTLRNHLLYGFSIALCYAVIRLSIPHYGPLNPDYQTFLLSRKVKEIAMLFINTCMTADLISLIHAPNRNLWIGGATLLLSLPFFYMVFIRQARLYATRPMLALLLSAFIVVFPNLLLSLSMMNAYAPLGMAALIVGYLINDNRHTRWITIAFSLYLLSALFIGAHTWYHSWKSGRLGQQLATEIIQKTRKPVEKAYFLIVEDDYPKLSSFCVIPSDALGWGWAVAHQNNYRWPETIKDTTIARTTDAAAIGRLTRKAFSQGYDCVWKIDHTHISVTLNHQR